MKGSEMYEIPKSSSLNVFLTNLKKDDKEKEKEKKKFETFSLEKDFLSKRRCTAYYFGSNPIAQKCFKCSECFRKKSTKLCEFCYEKCHSVCRLSSIVNDSNQENSQNHEKNNTNLQNFKIIEFACECGLKLKHKLPKKAKSNIVPCNMMRLDQILEVPKFHCLTHDISICCICSVLCHKKM